MSHCPACNGDELAKIDGEWVECPGLVLDEHVSDLERHLAEAQTQVKTDGDRMYMSLAHGLIERILTAEANCEPPEDIALRLESIIQERDALKATLAQVREALLKLGCTRPWLYGSMVVVTNEPTCREFAKKRPDAWPPKRWCCICVALAALEAGKEAWG